jgi:hypothetical protein
MTDDIVERLRARADRYEYAEQFDDESLAKGVLLKTRDLISEAADEIERLRLLRAPLLEIVYATKTDRTVHLTRSMLARAHDALRDSYWGEPS